MRGGLNREGGVFAILFEKGGLMERGLIRAFAVPPFSSPFCLNTQHLVIATEFTSNLVLDSLKFKKLLELQGKS